MFLSLFRHNKTPKVICLTFGVHVNESSRRLFIKYLLLAANSVASCSAVTANCSAVAASLVLAACALCRVAALLCLLAASVCLLLVVA